MIINSTPTSFVKKYASVYMALLLCRHIYTKLYKYENVQYADSTFFRLLARNKLDVIIHNLSAKKVL
jgi:hypothetical protein